MGGNSLFLGFLCPCADVFKCNRFLLVYGVVLTGETFFLAGMQSIICNVVLASGAGEPKSVSLE